MAAREIGTNKTQASAGSETDILLIGALTDGNSDPIVMPELRGIFDFVIRSADVGAPKPSERMFEAASAEAVRLLPTVLSDFPSD